jgi:hypothetical protein
MLGAVSERGLKLVGDGGGEVLEARFHDAASRQLRQLGGVGDDVRVNATGAAQLKTPAARPGEMSKDGSTPAVNVCPVE